MIYAVKRRMIKMKEEERRVRALISLFMICFMFVAGFVLTFWGLYMESIERAPVYVTVTGVGAFFMAMGTFLAIIQQKIEKMEEYREIMVPLHALIALGYAQSKASREGRVLSLEDMKEALDFADKVLKSRKT
jgi:undecaprenyl pyrophosphate phosphatase UppP